MQKPNLNRIMTDNLDKAKFQSKFNPSLPTDGWVNKYKRGGGMFPEYHSYAPPRMDGGGEPCYDQQGNVVDCEQQRLNQLGSSAYTAMQPFYETLYGAANKYKNTETGLVSPFNSMRATAKAFIKHPGVMFMKRHQLPAELWSQDAKVNPYHVEGYNMPGPTKIIEWSPSQWAEPRRERNTGDGSWWQRMKLKHEENKAERQGRRHRGSTGCWGANCTEAEMQDQAMYGGLLNRYATGGQAEKICYDENGYRVPCADETVPIEYTFDKNDPNLKKNAEIKKAEKSYIDLINETKRKGAMSEEEFDAIVSKHAPNLMDLEKYAVDLPTSEEQQQPVGWVNEKDGLRIITDNYDFPVNKEYRYLDPSNMSYVFGPNQSVIGMTNSKREFYPISGNGYATKKEDLEFLKDQNALNNYLKERSLFQPTTKQKYGGGLLSRKVTCSNCGWSWDAVDGGKDVMTCHKCGGGIKMEQGGMTQYGPGGSIMDGCPPYFTKNAFGVCVNASGQTQQQANAFKQTLNGVKASTTFDGSKYTGNSGTTGVNRVNYGSTPQGKHHEATLNTMKTSPGLSYQQASDRVNITNSSKANPSSMRSLTTAEVEKNKIDQKNEEWRKEHMNWVPGVESENEKVERWRKEDAEHDADVANTNSALLAKNNGQAYTFPTGQTKTWDQMDWREKAYVTGEAQSRDLKLFPNATADETLKTTLDEYNPFPILNRWVKGAATAPYVARETDSYMPYVGAVADPVVTLAAISAGQPELSAGELFTKQLFNWKKPVQTLGKIMTAVEEGELAGFAANKLRKDLIKGGGKDIIKSTETNVVESNGTTEQKPVIAEQMKQLKNTPSNQGINQAGLLNSGSIMSAINGFKSLGIPTSLLSNKYGGSTKRMKNWTDRYK